MFVAVNIYFGLRTETVMKSMYGSATNEFISSIKTNGEITLSDYERYMAKMGIGNSLFNISFEHRYKIQEPEYRFKTLEEVLEDQDKAYGGSNDYHYREVVTEGPYVDNPISDGNLNTDTNESIMANAVNTPADPSHVHDDSCYVGTKHVHTGNTSSGGGCYGNPSTEVCNGEVHSNGTYEIPDSPYDCPRGYYVNGVLKSCKGTVSTIMIGENYECSKGHRDYRTLYHYQQCSGECGYSYVYSAPPLKTKCSVNTTVYSLNCGKLAGSYYDANGNLSTPVCDQIIVSCTPTNVLQTVYNNDPIITTALATYKDGSTKTVICTTDFSTATPRQNATATLTYSYSVGGTTYTLTATVTVTVIPRSKVCPKGHSYNMNSDGSDPGCPYCRAWIDSLRVISPATSPIVITIGTSLIQNNVLLLATYMDGHTEEVSNAYIDNLDTSYLGTKPVTIGYKGASVTVMVTTVCATMKCDICEYEYNLYPDGSNPGCPRCIQKIPVFTGNIMEYEYTNNTEEILEELYIKGRYSFNVNDVFSIDVSNKTSTVGRKILGKIYPSLTDRWFVVKISEYILSK